MKKISILPLLLFILVVALFFKPVFLQGQLPIPSDTIIGLYHPFRDLYADRYPNGIPFKNFLTTDPVRQQFPWKNIAIESIAKGSLPLWNPYEMAGTPLLANFQSAALYPLNILYFFLPFGISWSILVILQPLLTGIFLYVYLRRMKLSEGAAAFGSITFAFCGFATAWLEWNTLVQTTLWLPLILLAIEYLLKKFTYRWAAVFIFSLTAALFAGHLQTFIYLISFVCAYLFARWIQLGRSYRLALSFLLLISCFLFLTAVQWIPSLQFINLSARSVDQINGWQQPGWFIPWQHLIQFIAPDFFGNPTTLNYWGVWNYGEFVGYIGIFPLVMAIFALYNRQDKKTLFFGAFFFLALIFALPTIFATLPYQWNIPLLASTQPTRLLFIADFSLAILAGLGLDFFIKSPKKWKVFYALGIVGIIFVGLWIFVFTGSKYFSGISVEQLLVAKRNLYIPTFFFIITTMILSVWVLVSSVKRFDNMLNRSLLTLLLLLFVLAVTIFDLVRFSQKFTPFTNSAYLFPPTKSLTYLQNQKGQFRIMATDSQIMPPNFSVMYHLQSLDGYDPLYVLRYGELISAANRNAPDITPPFGFNRIITPQNYDSPIINLLGVQYVLSLTDLKSSGLQKVFTEGDTKVYKNANAFPRTFFVTKVEEATDKNDAIKKLFAEKNNLRNTAILENVSGLAVKKFGNGSSTITDYEANKVVITTKNQTESFLVLTDTYYPIWKATICSPDGVDCKDTKVYLTDYNFRGIVVPSGQHHIVFYNSLL
jgi:hypothetical protein